MSTHSIPSLLAAAFLLATAAPAQEAMPAMPAGVPAGAAGFPGMGAPPPAPAAAFVPGRMIQMRPEEKRPLVLKESERNPYAKRNPQQEGEREETTNGEELKIRERLGELSVTGRSEGPNGLRVLLGDIILEEGRVLPQLIEDQSESLRVVELNEDTVVLGWLDLESGELTGKTMQVSYDLAPKVSYALHGQTAGESGEEPVQRLMGVMRIGEERRNHEPGSAAENLAGESSGEGSTAGR